MEAIERDVDRGSSGSGRLNTIGFAAAGEELVQRERGRVRKIEKQRMK